MKYFRFPDKGRASFLLWLRLNNVYRSLSKRILKNNMGWLYTPPHVDAVKIVQKFASQNPNHLGNWSLPNQNILDDSKLFEKEVIQMMIDLYYAKQKTIEGYFTSGGTEGNIFSAWIGREFLRQSVPVNTICLLKTSLTHYSISKAANIINVPEFYVPLHKDQWNIDPEGLHHVICDLYQKGFRAFLLPFTLGYTQTGTSDRAEQIIKEVAIAERKMDIRFFIWIDAALNGLIEPFINTTFKPFRSPLVQSLVVDFHKLGGLPYSSGIVLYRANLRKLIEKGIDYLPETDTTLLGSRSGIPAVAAWYLLQMMGKSGFKKTIINQLDNKRYFIKELKKIYPSENIISSPNSLTCALIIPKGDQRITEKVRNCYGLYTKTVDYLFFPKKTKKLRLYKWYFLPHMTKKVIKEFFKQISSTIPTPAGLVK